jgi:hypothetical protein
MCRAASRERRRADGTEHGAVLPFNTKGSFPAFGPREVGDIRFWPIGDCLQISLPQTLMAAAFMLTRVSEARRDMCINP